MNHVILSANCYYWVTILKNVLALYREKYSLIGIYNNEILKYYNFTKIIDRLMLLKSIYFNILFLDKFCLIVFFFNNDLYSLSFFISELKHEIRYLSLLKLNQLDYNYSYLLMLSLFLVLYASLLPFINRS